MPCGIFPRSKEHNRKLGLAKIGNRNPMWVGNKVGYGGVHGWVRRHLPKTKYCQCCGIKPPYDLANISDKYLRDLSDWEWLCRSCHMKKDGRTKCLVDYMKKHFRKLKKHEVIEIRRLNKYGVKQVQLAAMYGVSYQIISKIVRRDSWKEA